MEIPKGVTDNVPEMVGTGIAGGFIAGLVILIRRVISSPFNFEQKADDRREDIRREEDRRIAMHDLKNAIQTLIGAVERNTRAIMDLDSNMREYFKDFRDEIRHELDKHGES